MTRANSASPLGLAIKQMRVTKYGSHEAMAKAYGVPHRQTIINWENGKHLPNSTHRQRLVEDGIDPRLFLDERDLAKRLRELERQQTETARGLQEVQQLLRSLGPQA